MCSLGMDYMSVLLYCSVTHCEKLESTDAAPEVPHPRPTRLPAHRTASAIFFFFFSDSRRLSSICTDAAQFAPNRADSAKIGPYRPYRVVSAGGRYGQNRPKNGRNRPETAEIGLEYGCQSRNLHSSFFFCESRHSMCFLRII